MINIDESNYEYYQEIFNILWEFQAKYANIDPKVDYSPLKILLRTKKENNALARKGLQEGLNDTLTGFKDLPWKIKAELDESLSLSSFPSINTLTDQIVKVPKKVLKKGKIKNLDEYYVIKEYLAGKIPNEERKKLNRIVQEVEEKQESPKNLT